MNKQKIKNANYSWDDISKLTPDTVDFKRIYEVKASDPVFDEQKGLVRRHPLNRKINKGKVNGIKRRINKDNWKEFDPIRVNIRLDKNGAVVMTMLNGHHRTTGARLNKDADNIGIRIIFDRFDEDKECRVIHDLNVYQTNWSKDNCEDAAVKLDPNGPNAQIRRFCLSHDRLKKTDRSGNVKAITSYAWALLFGANLTKEEQIGNWSGTKKKLDLTAGEKMYKIGEDVIAAMGWDCKTRGNWIERLYKALYKLYDDKAAVAALSTGTFDAFLDNLRAAPYSGSDMANEQIFRHLKTVGLGLAA